MLEQLRELDCSDSERRGGMSNTTRSQSAWDRRSIATVERRIDFLASRVAQSEATNRDTGGLPYQFEKRELNALQWCVAEIRKFRPDLERDQNRRDNGERRTEEIT